MKNRFKSHDQKPFHPLRTQVKLVLASCIFCNWILGWGIDEYFPVEEDVTPDGKDMGHGVEAHDQEAWKKLRQEWADTM